MFTDASQAPRMEAFTFWHICLWFLICNMGTIIEALHFIELSGRLNEWIPTSTENSAWHIVQ